MTHIEDQGLEDAFETSMAWLDAGGFLNIGLRISPEKKELGKDYGAVPYHLMMIGRAQYACEFAYHRLQLAVEEGARQADSIARDRLHRLLRTYLEIHAFLVSANLYWTTLQKLGGKLALPELADALQRYAPAIKATKTARHHIEHISERISGGRGEQHGSPMTPEMFRKAMGRLEGQTIYFGDEPFNLGAIHEALRNVGRNIAPRLREQVQSAFSVGQRPLDAT